MDTTRKIQDSSKKEGKRGKAAYAVAVTHSTKEAPEVAKIDGPTSTWSLDGFCAFPWTSQLMEQSPAQPSNDAKILNRGDVDGHYDR